MGIRENFERRPLEQWWYKLNTGVASYEDQSSFTMGMVLKNDRGDFIAGKTEHIAS